MAAGVLPGGTVYMCFVGTCLLKWSYATWVVLWPCFQKWLQEFTQVAQYSMLWVQKVSGMLAIRNIENRFVESSLAGPPPRQVNLFLTNWYASSCGSEKDISIPLLIFCFVLFLPVTPRKSVSLCNHQLSDICPTGWVQQKHAAVIFSCFGVNVFSVELCTVSMLDQWCLTSTETSYGLFGMGGRGYWYLCWGTCSSSSLATTRTVES